MIVRIAFVWTVFFSFFFGLSAQENSTILNISTRAEVGTGSSAMSAGFFVDGTSPKKMLVRAIGVKLTDFGFSADEVLADAFLSIRDSSGFVVAENDDWSDSPDFSEIVSVSNHVGAFALTAESRDSAILVTLAPGSYTAKVTGLGGLTGKAIVEVYDVDADKVSDSRLVNISTRGLIPSETAKMNAGWVIEGTQSKNLLVRAVGSKLASFGLPGDMLFDPKVRVVQLDEGGAIISEILADDWATQDNADLIIQGADSAGAFPLSIVDDYYETAMMITAPPGKYSAIVDAARVEGSGICLVEVYEIGEFQSFPEFALESINRFEAKWLITEATFEEDQGLVTLILDEADFASGGYSYQKVSSDVGRVTYSNVNGYSGTIELTYVSPTMGRFQDAYSGEATGVDYGVFELISVGFAPQKITSLEASWEVRESTFSEEIGAGVFALSEEELASGLFSYEKISSDVGRLSYEGLNGYTGTILVMFDAERSGTFREDYVGPFDGFESGAFELIELNGVTF